MTPSTAAGDTDAGETVLALRAGDVSPDRARADLAPVVSAAVASLAALPAPQEATDRAVALVSGSVLEDFDTLEALMRRLGGDYAASDSDFAQMRRWWRSVPRSSRPAFAAEMTDNAWEHWINRADLSDLTRLPDDTRAPVRTIDRGAIRSASYDAFNRETADAIDATLRGMARERGFNNPDRAQIVGFHGRLRYRPPDADEPDPSQLFVLFVAGVSADDRDFVAAYIFAHRGPTGWFPYLVRSLSQHRDTTPPARRIPFVPAF